MIFVTVGTHEQPFNRLVEYMDRWAANSGEEVVIQTGFSTYEPKTCKWSKLYPYPQMLEFVKQARIVITHGGPSSFIMPLQEKKIPIVVPRQKKYGEHVNDHQLEFAKAVAERQKNILVIEDVEELGDLLSNYDQKITEMSSELSSNNAVFNEKLSDLVNEMFGRK